MKLEELSSESLMEIYGSDQSGAFEEIYKRYHRRLYGYFISRTKSQEAANDLVQDFFKNIHIHRSKYNPRWKVDAWFFTIAHNLLVNYFRYNGLRKYCLLEDNIPGKSIINKRVNLMDVEKMVEKLPPVHKKAIVLRYFKDNDYEEISRKIQKTPVNARKIISRGLEKLREQIN